MNPFIINLNTYTDTRGIFYESYKNILLKEYNIDFNIEQENTSISHKNVIRGFHYQVKPYSQAKLLTVLKGKIKDVLIDIRKTENTYGRIWEYELNSNIKQLLYIPEGFAHGYSVLEDNTIVSYKTDGLYNKDSERGFNPLSSTLNIDWKVSNKCISDKDKNLKIFIF